MASYQGKRVQSALAIHRLALLFFAALTRTYYYPKFVTRLKSPLLRLRIRQNTPFLLLFPMFFYCGPR